MMSGMEILYEIEALGLKKVTEPNDNASIAKATDVDGRRRVSSWIGRTGARY